MSLEMKLRNTGNVRTTHSPTNLAQSCKAAADLGLQLFSGCRAQIAGKAGTLVAPGGKDRRFSLCEPSAFIRALLAGTGVFDATARVLAPLCGEATLFLDGSGFGCSYTTGQASRRQLHGRLWDAARNGKQAGKSGPPHRVLGNCGMGPGSRRADGKEMADRRAGKPCFPGVRQQEGERASEGLFRTNRAAGGQRHSLTQVLQTSLNNTRKTEQRVLSLTQGPFGARGTLEDLRSGPEASLSPGVQPLPQGHGALAGRLTEGNCGPSWGACRTVACIPPWTATGSRDRGGRSCLRPDDGGLDGRDRWLGCQVSSAACPWGSSASCSWPGPWHAASPDGGGQWLDAACWLRQG